MHEWGNYKQLHFLFWSLISTEYTLLKCTEFRALKDLTFKSIYLSLCGLTSTRS